MKHRAKDNLTAKNRNIYLGFQDNESPKDNIDNKIKDELKIRIIYSAIAIFVSFMLGFLFSGYLIKILQAQALTIKFIQLSPDESLTASLKVTIFFGLYFSSPFVLYQLARLKLNDNKFLSKNFVLKLLTGSFFLFFLGILFAYYALIPSILFFLLGFNSNLAATSFSISKYVSFCLQIILISGIIFEFPIFLVLLAKTNFINYKKLVSSWKKVAIGAFIFSIVLTSSELLTQVFLAGIILLFYGLAIATTRIVEK